MLKLACRRFRAELTPGLAGRDDPHLRTCPACAAYAAAMERAAKRVPLPARLESKLRAIPGARVDDSEGPRLPLPQAPLPAGLRDRLRGVTAMRARRPLPPWVRSSRYAVAASYLMAVLLGTALGNPSDLGRQAADAFSRLFVTRLEQAVTEARDEGTERLGTLQDAMRERYGETRRSIEASVRTLGSLGDRIAQVPQTFRWLNPLTNRGPLQETPGPQGE